MTPVYKTLREHFKVILSATGNEFSDHSEPELVILLQRARSLKTNTEPNKTYHRLGYLGS